jgi:alanine-glyoxylate transaminase/serine-glyoxylate transaminase/serine-pyruvate transaminase
MVLTEGLGQIHRRHAHLAAAVRGAVARWAEGGALAFNIRAAEERSNAVTTVLMNDGFPPDPLLAYCRDKCAVTLGIGIGDLNGRAFRIAHMGYVNAPMILGTLGVVEMALAALDLPHEPGGVQAAVDVLARSVPA